MPVCRLGIANDSQYQTGETQTDSMVGGGERDTETERGSTRGAFHSVGQDVKVMSLSIRSDGPLARVGCGCVFSQRTAS